MKSEKKETLVQKRLIRGAAMTDIKENGRSVFYRVQKCLRAMFSTIADLSIKSFLSENKVVLGEILTDGCCADQPGAELQKS